MRRMISQKLIEWIKSIKNHLVQNGNTTEIGGNLEVDGEVQVNSDIAVNGTAQLAEINIEGFSKILDNDGRQIGKDLEDAVSGNNEMVITFTEDDWDEYEEQYVKHLEFNNTYFKIVFDGTPVHEDSFLMIYNPYFKGTIDLNEISTFEGIDNEIQERYTIFELTADGHWFSIFNGVLSHLTTIL